MGFWVAFMTALAEINLSTLTTSSNCVLFLLLLLYPETRHTEAHLV